MKVAGSAVIGADRQRVWAALQDPAVLVRTIPGCERLEETAPDTYRMTVSAGVATIRGVYDGEVALTSPLPPDSFVLKARGAGAPGTVEATVEVRLSPVDDGTRVDYDAEAVVGGMIGGVGQRMLSAVAKRTAADFFTAVESALLTPHPTHPGPAIPLQPPAQNGESTHPAPASAAGTLPAGGQPAATGTEGAVYVRPAAPSATPSGTMLAAFGLGALTGLAGVVIGWLLGRRRTRQ